jgi:hypothetical protein
VQRCYYQPVTTYQSRSYYESVTSYRTSYYYEPVTSYTYSSYYDPCTGCCQQVACPVTSYALRSQCCPVQNWVQRCCQVPVTSYQQMSYYEPVTTCCAPPPQPCCAAPPAQPCCPTGYTAPGPNGGPAGGPPGNGAPPPVVTEPNQPGPPAVREYPNGAANGGGAQGYDRYYPTPDGSAMPPANGAARRAAPRLPLAPVPAARPGVRLDHIVSGPTARIEGQVVSNGNAPRAGARVMFVSAALHGPQRTVSADSAGKFRVTLASGGWLVYVKGTDNRPVFYSKISVRDNESRRFTLVSR